MITVRRARPADAAGIGLVHVAAWRSAYPGILPNSYLAGLSPARQAAQYGHAIRHGVIVHVAAAEIGIVGFITADHARNRRLGDGEVETLYVLDDYRDQGIGRRLMSAAAADLKAHGCKTVYVWVLRDNPSCWFYEHLAGKRVAEGTIGVAGARIAQNAYKWEPIERLLEATRQTLK